MNVKLRAWSIIIGSMAKVSSIDYSKNEVVLLIYNPESGEYHLSYGWGIEDLKVMRCSGDKDRDNKEIYEGDIVAYTENGERKIDFIELTDNGFKHSKTGRWNPKEDIVIGNIYENPEMIEIMNK